MCDNETENQFANESPEQDAKLTDDELIDLTAKQILKKYKTAFHKLAENE